MTVATTTLAAFGCYGRSNTRFTDNGIICRNDRFVNQCFINRYCFTRWAWCARLTLAWRTRGALCRRNGSRRFQWLINLAAAANGLHFQVLTIATITVAIAIAWITIALTALTLTLTLRTVLTLTLCVAA